MRLAGGPLGIWPATPLLRSWLGSALGGRLAVAGAVGGALLGLNACDGRADPLPVNPLGRVTWVGAEGPLGVGDLVGAPVLFDLGGGVAPGSPTPGRFGNWAKDLEEIACAVGLDG